MWLNQILQIHYLKLYTYVLYFYVLWRNIIYIGTEGSYNAAWQNINNSKNIFSQQSIRKDNISSIINYIRYAVMYLVPKFAYLKNQVAICKKIARPFF